MNCQWPYRETIHRHARALRDRDVFSEWQLISWITDNWPAFSVRRNANHRMINHLQQQKSAKQIILNGGSIRIVQWHVYIVQLTSHKKSIKFRRNQKSHVEFGARIHMPNYFNFTHVMCEKIAHVFAYYKFYYIFISLCPRNRVLFAQANDERVQRCLINETNFLCTKQHTHTHPTQGKSVAKREPARVRTRAQLQMQLNSRKMKWKKTKKDFTSCRLLVTIDRCSSLSCLLPMDRYVYSTDCIYALCTGTRQWNSEKSLAYRPLLYIYSYMNIRTG